MDNGEVTWIFQLVASPYWQFLYSAHSKVFHALVLDCTRVRARVRFVFIGLNTVGVKTSFETYGSEGESCSAVHFISWGQIQLFTTLKSSIHLYTSILTQTRRHLFSFFVGDITLFHANFMLHYTSSTLLLLWLIASPSFHPSYLAPSVCAPEGCRRCFCPSSDKL